MSAGGTAMSCSNRRGGFLSLLNRHLYRSTQPEKYATLFLAHYDADSAHADVFQCWSASAAGAWAGWGRFVGWTEGGTVVGLMDGMQL